MSSQMLASMVAISDRASMLSLVGQLFALALAVVVGRFAIRSRVGTLLVSVLGAVGAMVVNILVDGQGAFLYLGFAPVLYLVSVAGRRDLQPR